MTIGEAYLKFIQRVNRNLTNDNISVDRGRFILLLNQSIIEVCEYILEKKNEDNIHYLQKLVVHNKELERSSKTINTRGFKIPENFLDFINTRVIASDKVCKKQPLQLWEAKMEDVDELLFEESNKPSFKFRETFYTLGDDKINYYVDGFDIDKAYMSYYRFPKKVDIEGYLRSDGSLSTNVNPEMDDRFMERVITKAASNYAANNSYFDSFQVNENRVINKI